MASIDYSRTFPVQENTLQRYNGRIAGYVRFDAAGYLQARSYDDVYGAVYCGFSRSKIRVEPRAAASFVQLDTCGVGDGGLDQVHEVCWFPDGSEEGITIFTSAYRVSKSLPVTALFTADQIGNERYFNGRVVHEVLAQLFREKNMSAASSLIEESLVLLSRNPGAIDGTTRKPIPSREFLVEDWAQILMSKLGASIGTESFAQTAADAEQIISNPTVRFCHPCETYRELMPYYRWIDAKAAGRKIEIPVPPSNGRRVMGHDPVVIAGILSRSVNEEMSRSLRFDRVGEFWIGCRDLFYGDKESAFAHLDAFLVNSTDSSLSRFEVAAAARLLTTEGKKIDQIE